MILNEWKLEKNENKFNIYLWQQRLKVFSIDASMHQASFSVFRMMLDHRNVDWIFPVKCFSKQLIIPTLIVYTQFLFIFFETTASKIISFLLILIFLLFY